MLTKRAAEAAEFDEFYFSRYVGPSRYQRDEHWLGVFDAIADRIVKDLQPRRVLDAGCAMGFLVEALRDRGVDAFGFDISDYALQHVRPDLRDYCWKASVDDALSEEYDLIVSIEVLEHVPADVAERAVVNFAAHAPDVLFSSTPVDYKEATHLNVRPPEYWAELFAREGFFRDVDYDPTTYVSPWAIRYRRSREPVARLVAGYERLLWHLKQDSQAMRELNREQREELEAQQALVAEAEAALEELRLIKGTVTWQAVHKLQEQLRRSIPAHTRRGRFLRVAARTVTRGSPGS